MTMTHTIRRAVLPSVCTAALLLAAPHASAQSAAPVTATGAWVREVPAGRSTTGIFVTVKNSGAKARAIVSGKASVGDTLELHEMKSENGMMRMAPVKSIDVPAGGQVELKPGGLHLMLFGLKKPLTVGDTVQVDLTLDDGSHVKLSAPVRKMGGM